MRRALALALARAFTRVLVCACAPAATLAQPACAQQPDAAAALREGRYDDAIALYSRRVEAAGAVADRRMLVRALMAVGRYEDAERVARSGEGAAPVEMANTLGEVLYLRGRVEAAEAAFRAAEEGGASDRLDARLNLAVLLERRGERAAARAIFDSFIDVYNRGEARTAGELAAVATAVRHLGGSDPALFQDAVRAYGRAIVADSTGHEARVLLGGLFLEKYNSTDAQTVLGEVLRVNPNHPRALLALARAKRFDGSAEALELVQRSLEVNPNLIPARVFLALLRLELGDYDAATEEAERALAANPASLEALGILAAARYLSGDRAGYEETRHRALTLDPGYADLYNTVAELAARQRRYGEAVTLAGEAVALDSASWRGYALLGLNQLRVGRIDAARASLETAFAGDPYNVWVKNTLDLLDTFEQYAVRATDRFSFFLHADEADLLFPYMAAVAEAAYDSLSKRYGYRPEPPVRVEVYPRHADFSVRTVGLAGLGALGVSFGDLLVLDSPAAREAGSFNWASTLWHEIAHAFTLGATAHRIPRWLTEGLSVLEERRARPAWGAEVTLDFLLAYREGRLLPVSRLNDGFVRPTYPQQVGHAYYQASLVAEMIERDHGFDAVRAMLAAYRAGRSTEEVLRDVLGTSPEDFDAAFDAYLRERFAPRLAALRTLEVKASAPPEAGPQVVPVGATSPAEAVREADAAPGDFIAQLTAGHVLFETGQLATAQPYFERARDLFPEYTAADNPYRALAQIHERQGDPRAAADALEALTAHGETDYAANLELARLLEGLGDAAGAAAALERALTIYPYEIEPHTRLAALYDRLGDAGGVVRERRAIVALAPADRADALYRLALAYLEAGDAAAARREVLRALEAAPGFAEAQELLLRLHEGRDGGESPNGDGRSRKERPAQGVLRDPEAAAGQHDHVHGSQGFVGKDGP